MKIVSTVVLFVLLKGMAIQGDGAIRPNAKCGSGVGSCTGNSCCSKYGYCGKTDDHCNLTKGCQLNYGLCYSSDLKHCGKDVGLCKEGYCCSKHGYCGTTDDYCNVSKGCQLDYGLCYEEDGHDGNEGGGGGGDDKLECGKGYGVCPDGKCCSFNGKCGTGDSYCNVKNGCQIDYGLCYKPVGTIREGSGKSCGQGIGSCDFPDCCSKSGKCVLGTDECLESNGCKTEYGLCLSNS